MRTASQRQSRQKNRIKEEAIRDLKRQINASVDESKQHDAMDSYSNNNLIQKSIKTDVAIDSILAPQDRCNSTQIGKEGTDYAAM